MFGRPPSPRASTGSSSADLVIHRWDLARATGQDETLPPTRCGASTRCSARWTRRCAGRGVRTQGRAAARRRRADRAALLPRSPGLTERIPTAPDRVRIRPAARRRRNRHDGAMSVQGVITTGIYCVPSCSARPLPAHVVPYRSPAEAEAAGFRACLRCRPHRQRARVGHRARAGVPGGAPHHRGRARRTPRGRPGGGPRRVGPPPAPAVRRARGHHTRPAGAEPSRPLRPPAPGGHRPVGDRHRVGQRVRQPAAAQPGEPAGVPRATHRAARAPPARRSAPGRRRSHPAAALPRRRSTGTSLLDYFAHPGDRRCRARRRRHLPPHDRGRWPPRRPRAQPRGGRATSTSAPTSPTSAVSSTSWSEPARSSPSIATRPRPTRCLAGDPLFAAASWRRGRACACRAPGTRTRPACAPSWASR